MKFLGLLFAAISNAFNDTWNVLRFFPEFVTGNLPPDVTRVYYLTRSAEELSSFVLPVILGLLLVVAHQHARRALLRTTHQ